MASFLDTVKFFPTLGGTTDWTVAAAVLGYQTPALGGAVNGKTYRYRAESLDLTQWEVATGVYNTTGPVLTRASVHYNSLGTGLGAGQSGAGSKINFSLVPQVGIVALAEDCGPLTLASSTIQVNTGSPAATASATGVMMGLGASAVLTPSYSSRVFFNFQGALNGNTAAAQLNVGARFGTGTAPVNAAALTGTLVSSVPAQINASAPNFLFPFRAGGIITGLTPGTTYWFDLSLSSSSGNGAIFSSVFDAMEF